MTVRHRLEASQVLFTIKSLAIKTSTGLLIAGAAGLLGYLLVGKARSATNLVFFPGRITSMGWTNGTPILRFDLTVQNTNSSEVDFESFAGNVFSNNSLIGNVSNFSSIIIPGNSTVNVPITVQLRIVGIVTNILRAFEYKNFAQAVVVNGYANVSGVQVPVDLSLAVGSDA